MSDVRIICDGQNRLGEGPIWHGQSAQLIWFDILERQMFACRADGTELKQWQFDEAFSAAAATVDDDQLLMASETGLWRFSFSDGLGDKIFSVEADNKVTRSNDSRADRRGGFWMGTMGWNAEEGAGAIYRYSGGQIETVADNIGISNAICFSPDGRFGFYVDTLVNKIMRVPLNAETGDIIGSAEVFIDEQGAGFGVDGAVIDSEGYLWSARWNDSSVARYRRDGSFEDKIIFPASQITCPAFGGPVLKTLFVTSAADGLDKTTNPYAGNVFAVDLDVAGLADVPVKL